MAANTNNKKPNKTKPVTKIMSLEVSGVDHRGTEYDPGSVYEILCDLQDSNVFSKLSISITVKKAKCTGDEEAKGYMSIARIQSYDKELGQMSVSFFGKNAEYAHIADNMCIIPRVRVSRNSTDVSSILGFEMVDRND